MVTLGPCESGTSAPDRFCRAHLLGEHRELHAIWSVLTGDKAGYRKHPETLRWENRLAALYARHTALVEDKPCNRVGTPIRARSTPNSPPEAQSRTATWILPKRRSRSCGRKACGCAV